MGPKILNSYALLASAYRLRNQQDRKVTVPSKGPLKLLDRKAVIDQQILNLGCPSILIMIIMKSTLSSLMDVDKVLENEERKPPIRNGIHQEKASVLKKGCMQVVKGKGEFMWQDGGKGQTPSPLDWKQQ